MYRCITHILVFKVGCIIRWLFYKCLYKSVNIKIIAKGIAHPKTKKDEEYNIKNEIANRLVGVGFWVVVLSVLYVSGII